MNKPSIIGLIKAVLALAISVVGLICIIVALGASVAWITGWSLVKGSLAVVLGAIVSIGSQAAVKDL